LNQQLEAQEVLLDLTIAPFEPLTPGNGQNIGEKKEKLANAIKERIPQENLERLRRQLAGRLVGITVVFLLWKGSSTVTNTRPIKDLDNLLKIVFDALRQGPHGLGIIEEDSYIGEVYATKQLVDTEDREGYRIIIEEHHDPEMLRTLKQYYEKIPAQSSGSNENGELYSRISIHVYLLRMRPAVNQRIVGLRR
jgi:Holliday junction resolvase RusA-like endonuclease